MTSSGTEVPSNKAIEALADARRVLLLQGPIGPFFKDLGTLLRAHGKTVTHVAFNAADLHFNLGAKPYFGGFYQWSKAFEEMLTGLDIDVCVLFGQDRPVHAVARVVCLMHNVPVVVFEEGYIRPYHVTMELGGVNSLSSFDIGRARLRDARVVEPFKQAELRISFAEVASLAMRYQYILATNFWMYPRYNHHRKVSWVHEGIAWCKSYGLKLRFRKRYDAIVQRLNKEAGFEYFLVPLQVKFDAQQRYYSPYPSIPKFIENVVESFAREADDSVHLIFKHHPMDRGHSDYGALIQRLSVQHGVGARVHYLYDGHLPTLLQRAKGLVCINSTVGYTAIEYGVPVIALAPTVFNCPELTYQGSLGDFWSAGFAPDMGFFRQFQFELAAQTQLPGNFYSPSTRYGGILASIHGSLLACSHGTGGQPMSDAPQVCQAGYSEGQTLIFPVLFALFLLSLSLLNSFVDN